ncbi:hypothetical protein HDU97_009143 [Phlyctochytrium planicorne]|nr:hypothetical protein HDU97_009143 [Phlyctochytrium planicorne]
MRSISAVIHALILAITLAASHVRAACPSYSVTADVTQPPTYTYFLCVNVLNQPPSQLSGNTFYFTPNKGYNVTAGDVVTFTASNAVVYSSNNVVMNLVKPIAMNTTPTKIVLTTPGLYAKRAVRFGLADPTLRLTVGKTFVFNVETLFKGCSTTTSFTVYITPGLC